jgi:NTP pyrophosphatase (non-canonical NTP hydrolase)
MLHFDQLSKEQQDRILASNKSFEETMSEYSRDPNSDMNADQIRTDERIKELEETAENLRNSLHRKEERLRRIGEVDTSRVPKVEDIPPRIPFIDLEPAEQARAMAADQVIQDVEDGTLKWEDLTPEGKALFADAEALPDLPLSFEKYQAGARETAIYNQDARVLYPALGLSGEVGEVIEKVLEMAKHAGMVANQVKKIIRDDDCECDTPRKHDIGKELGGVLWYLSAVASDLGLDLGAIAQENLDVLASRQERGVIQGDGDNR